MSRLSGSLKPASFRVSAPLSFRITTSGRKHFAATAETALGKIRLILECVVRSVLRAIGISDRVVRRIDIGEHRRAGYLGGARESILTIDVGHRELLR